VKYTIEVNAIELTDLQCALDITVTRYRSHAERQGEDESGYWNRHADRLKALLDKIQDL
jgi:hypothetical protein